MKEQQFKTDLLSVLMIHEAQSRDAIKRIAAKVPENARGLALVIFTSQEGDGEFSIFGSIEGPDHYHINKSIVDVKDIFDVRTTELGFEPPVPMLDPNDVTFDVNDVLIETVAKWLENLWQTIDNSSLTIPVYIVGHDGISPTLRIELKE